MEVKSRMHVPDGQSNPGGFDAELMQWERGVRAVATVRAAHARWMSELARLVLAGRVDRFRSWVRDRIHAQVPDARLAGVLAGWLWVIKAQLIRLIGRCSGRRESRTWSVSAAVTWPCSAGWRRG